MYLEWGYLKEALNTYQVVLDLVTRIKRRILLRNKKFRTLWHHIVSTFFYVKESYEKMAHIYLKLYQEEEALDSLLKASI
ncbi:MAG: hypothetical protein ACOYJ1_11920 [Peptococcales bacterium]|jgi:hypothetical protein